MKSTKNSPSTKNQATKNQATKNQANAVSSRESSPPPNESLVARVIVLVSRKSYDEAANLLRTAPRSTWTSNTLGVCLLRSGRIDEAIQVYRSLVLNPGTTVMAAGVDDLTKVNFATALMLKGTPSGALDVLAELRSPEIQPAVRLRDAISRWSKSLSLWRRLDWKLNRIDPPNSQVPIDFEPGEFTFAVQRKTDEFPSKPTAPKLAA